MSPPFTTTLSALDGLRVLVIGDVMLDAYVSGSSGRLCPEAPVPVVAVSDTRAVPGGAANVAANARALGAEVELLSVMGDDLEAGLLADALHRLDLRDASVIRESGRRSLVKTRVITEGHMLVRYDQGDTGPVRKDSQASLISQLQELAPLCDVILVSDYGYGVLTEAVIDALVSTQADAPRVLGVDAKVLSRYRDAGVSVVKPNYAQAAAMLADADGRRGHPRLSAPCQPGARAEAIRPFGPRLRQLCGAEVVAVTLDREGAIIFERGGPGYRTYARPHTQLRAAGAGDTFLAALTLALAAGADLPSGAELASTAAAVVMGKEGTATCAAWELIESVSATAKILAADRVEPRMDLYRSQGRRIVFTNGCFDILHPGHTGFLSRAKALGDVLVVGLNSDASVRRLKGPTRPVNPQDDRAEVLSALSCVDHVVVFDQDDPRELIKAVRPHLFVKGRDYTRAGLVEGDVVEQLGGQVHILAYEPDRSTTGVIERIRQAPARVTVPPLDPVAG